MLDNTVPKITFQNLMILQHNEDLNEIFCGGITKEQEKLRTTYEVHDERAWTHLTGLGFSTRGSSCIKREGIPEQPR